MARPFSLVRRREGVHVHPGPGGGGILLPQHPDLNLVARRRAHGLPVHNYSECYERPEDAPDDAVLPVVPYLGFVNARSDNFIGPVCR
jgi:hypothetical protein